MRETTTKRLTVPRFLALLKRCRSFSQEAGSFRNIYEESGYYSLRGSVVDLLKSLEASPPIIGRGGVKRQAYEAAHGLCSRFLSETHHSESAFVERLAKTHRGCCDGVPNGNECAHDQARALLAQITPK